MSSTATPDRLDDTDMIENVTFDELHIGQTARLVRTLSQADIQAFAAVSGDTVVAAADNAGCHLERLDVVRDLADLQRPPVRRRVLRRQRLEAPDGPQLRQFARLGVPGGLAVLVEVSSFTLMALFIARLGTTASAAHQIASNLTAVAYMAPLALGLATLVARRKFDKAQQEGGKAALVLGLCFITEGAIPFAARDPMRVLPCCIVGGAVTGAISMAVGAKLMAPHGGLFVLLIPGAITPVLGYLLAIIAGTLVAGLSYAVLKRPEAEVVAAKAA